jgi:hypothetical protein
MTGFDDKGAARRQDSRDGLVYIAEDVDFDDKGCGLVLTARFSAHWESLPDGEQWEQGPEGVPVEDAIEWGRAQADRVIIRVGVGNEQYSAGRSHSRDRNLPQWPASGVSLLRRPVE